MDEIFPPYICAHGPGEDPFEVVMCTVGTASQISFCLLKELFLIQNITCISTGFYFIEKLFNYAVKCQQIISDYLLAVVFNLPGKIMLQTR